MNDEATEPSAAPHHPDARTIAPWADEALLRTASHASWHGGAAVFADRIEVRPRGFRNHIDSLLAAGFDNVRRAGSTLYVLTREAVEERARRDAALAEASKPENVRRFEVAVFVRGSDVPTERSTTKPDYTTAAQWATKRLVDPEVAYSHAIITTTDGFGDILVRDELRVTIKQVYKK